MLHVLQYLMLLKVPNKLLNLHYLLQSIYLHYIQHGLTATCHYIFEKFQSIHTSCKYVLISIIHLDIPESQFYNNVTVLKLKQHLITYQHRCERVLIPHHYITAYRSTDNI
jgi:hypothetical protein